MHRNHRRSQSGFGKGEEAGEGKWTDGGHHSCAEGVTTGGSGGIVGGEMLKNVGVSGSRNGVTTIS